MSEPIQSIATNNYILHNIDAKKLYVQEPLFTANSGDAVYVGWRPDETVLFEYTGTDYNNNRQTTFSISEYFKNFDRIRVETRGYPGGFPQPGITEFLPTDNITDNISFCTTYYCLTNDSNPLQIQGERFSSTNGLDYTYIDGKLIYSPYNGNTWTNTTANRACITKIVGINRKEKA